MICSQPNSSVCQSPMNLSPCSLRSFSEKDKSLTAIFACLDNEFWIGCYYHPITKFVSCYPKINRIGLTTLYFFDPRYSAMLGTYSFLSWFQTKRWLHSTGCLALTSSRFSQRSSRLCAFIYSWKNVCIGC